MMGLGKASRNENTAYFVVCNSKKLDEIRKMYGLKEHDFHITLGFKHKDVFGVRKNKVFEPNKEFIDRIKSKFLEKENFNFVRNIGNFDDNPELEIIPISISDDYLKVKVGDNILNIGLIDTKDGEKLWISNRYIDDKDEKRVSDSRLAKCAYCKALIFAYFVICDTKKENGISRNIVFMAKTECWR